jgi:SAM-dependent methyltransferase
VDAGAEQTRSVDYVPETRFGEWFQRTDIWRRYVVDEAIAELATLLPPGAAPFANVVDAGCGEGVAFAGLRRVLGAERLLGVDINPAAVAAAAPLAAAAGPGVTLLQANAARLPLPDGGFDLVFCHQLLHHSTDPVAVLRELRRVLRPGGWLLVSESCADFLQWWVVRLLFRHPVRAQHSPDGYVELIKAAGFVLPPAQVDRPTPWWSLPDLGLRARIAGARHQPVPTQVRIAAQVPAA